MFLVWKLDISLVGCMIYSYEGMPITDHFEFEMCIPLLICLNQFAFFAGGSSKRFQMNSFYSGYLREFGPHRSRYMRMTHLKVEPKAG